ncbi:hypothetical protein WJX72_004237 [[Myrmecia] bisecta]|uniref:Uncharacterized protein n=1 Tax=[Myrmecia] bisecta TaxID=41462 RepID=A0AAW1QEW7_9CHLO
MQAGLPTAQIPGGCKPAAGNAHRSLNAPLRPYHAAKPFPGTAPGGKQDTKPKSAAQAPKEALHPSREAKKRQAAVMAKPQGTKIVFDD